MEKKTSKATVSMGVIFSVAFVLFSSHAGGDVTERVYTHKNIRQLRKCIELLK